MKTISLLFFSVLSISFLTAQSLDKAFVNAYNRISTQRIFNLNNPDPEKRKQDSLEIIEMNRLLKVLNDFRKVQHSMNGSAGFSFSGNESDLSNLYRVGVSGALDGGAYPYEVDFSINVQTTIQNGTFQESLSDIDVSFDFHPITPDELKPKEKAGKYGGVVSSIPDGLWKESYVFLKRFNNNFLGIQQRYEAGAGVVFNFYSAGLTKRGQSTMKSLEQIPKYETYGDDLMRCLEECYLKKSVLNITAAEAETIARSRERYKRSNKKKYYKFRMGLLFGLYYELEQAVAKNKVNFNGVDTLITETFAPTNKLRWELRPTIVWQPHDKYKFRIYPYFKLPLGEVNSIVREGELSDTRYDYFVDMLSSFIIQVEDNFTVSLNYRLMYDNAPKRRYLQQRDGNFVLLSGQRRHDNFGVSLKFGF